MAEYIDRNLVLSAMNVVVEHANAIAGDSEILQRVCSILEDCKNIVAVVSAEDVAPVVHGRWVPKRKMYRTPTAKNYTCSECGLPVSECWHFCSNCGARMDGGVSDG